PSVSTISIAFAPDGRTVASTHGDHTVKVTCAHTGKLIRQLEGHPRTPWTVKYHPTNSRIIASGCLGFQVRVWDWNFQTEAVRKGRRRQKESNFHPSGDLMAIASGSTLHLWDYNDENKRDGSRQSDALLLDPDRERNADFPRGRTLEIRHVNALRCTHFPPSGSTIIIGSVNPSSSNDGLGNARARRGGMAGGGMSFHLRLWDFDLDAILHPTAEEVPTNATARVGKVSEEGEITWNFLTMRPPMSNVSYI
ncbi:hypothetical protein THAPSDRAFT_261472, partial [Thalassiosira pseudonana CCMP1335]